MKFRHSGSERDEKMELQMTPMIDIVFQLLIFFIMTFKIVIPEADVTTKQLIGPSSSVDAPEPNKFEIKLSAYSNKENRNYGHLRLITILSHAEDGSDAKTFGNDLAALQQHFIGGGSGLSEKDWKETNITIHCDKHLRYLYTSQATDILRQYSKDGTTVPMFENISLGKFEGLPDVVEAMDVEKKK